MRASVDGVSQREGLDAELRLISDQLIAALLRRLQAVAAERDSFRELAHAAVHELHDLTVRHDRLIVVHRALRDERRHERTIDADIDWPSARASADDCTTEARA